MMKNILLTAAAFVLLSCSTREPLSERIVRSEMARCPEATFLDRQGGNYKWNYTTGLELLSFLDVFEAYGGDDILEYVLSWYDGIIGPDGKIFKYKVSNYSLDHICPGRTLLHLYEMTGQEKFKVAMDTLFHQISTQPRTADGGFWHKKIYPGQMWLDGLYMGGPFYAEYTIRHVPDSLKAACFADIAHQFVTVASHTYDPATGLYRHAWDGSEEKMFWADPVTGQSDHAWGRALGWYCMALVDVIPLLPDATPGKDRMKEILKGIFDVLPEYADPATGLWYQVLDCPGREGNYLEATCNAMFVYSMLKGTRLGLLDIPRKELEEKYGSFVRTFISEDGNGLLELNRCCEVAGLGGKDNRRGDYDYYINEKIGPNDPKGIGPAVWAALEMERL